MKIVDIFLLCFLFFGCKQSNLKEIRKYYKNENLKEVYYLDEHKSAQGKDIKYYKNGKIKEINNYKNGNLQGYACNLYQNGQLEIKSKYNSNKLIDTFYQFLSNGKLEAKVIYDKDGNKIKEIFFHSNSKVNKIRDYFIGKEQFSAWKEYYEDGKLNKNESNFVQITDLGKNEIKLLLVENSPYDTIYVKIIESFNYKVEGKPKILRELKFTDVNNVRFKIFESDYFNNKLNIKITKQKWFVVPEKTPFGYINGKISGSQIQLTKGEKIPKDNLNGIYRKY
jgi:hypothetical protein